MENLRFAFRYLMKMRGNNLIRILSLSLGLSVALLLFSYAHYRLTSDRCFRDGERIWQIWSVSDRFGFSSMLNAPIAPALAAEIPQIEAATRIFGPQSDDVVLDEHAFEARYILADTSFFAVLGFDVLRGDPKEILRHEEQAMLSEGLARRIFGDEDPVGRQILFKGNRPLTVGGIFRDPPANQHLGKFNMLLSFEVAERTMNTDWRGGDSFPSYVKLHPGADIAAVEAQLPEFYKRHGLDETMKIWGVTTFFYPISYASKVDSPVVLVAWILMTLAALALFVAAMNYVLVSVSTLVTRSRTIAMLKVNGARRADIFAVFCWETALLTLASLLAAAFLIWGLQNQIRDVTETPVGELFAWQRIWVPLCVVVTSFSLAALIPAQLFTAVPLSLAFRGTAANRRRWKHALLFTEVLCVTLVSVLLVVMYLQFDRLRNGDFGFGHDRLVYSRLMTPLNRLGAVCGEMAAMPEVEAAGASADLPMWGLSGQPCYDENTKQLLFSCRFLICNEGFIPTMQMRMAAGRNFTPSGNPLEAIVNETYVRMRGWTPEEAIGRQIIDTNDASPLTYTIVGVVKDFRTVVVDGTIDPLVMHPFNMYLHYGIDAERRFDHLLVLRLRELTPEALAAVQRKIEEYPSDNNHTLMVYDQRLADALAEIRSYRNIVLTVDVIVLLIALSGLIGYLSDEVHRRGKEVALRKVHGATAGSVVRLLGRDIAALCIPAMAVGLAVSWWSARQILSMFVERIALGGWIFAVCALGVAAVVAVVLIVCTWRIANSNPVKMLKSE